MVKWQFSRRPNDLKSAAIPKRDGLDLSNEYLLVPQEAAKLHVGKVKDIKVRVLSFLLQIWILRISNFFSCTFADPCGIGICSTSIKSSN